MTAAARKASPASSVVSIGATAPTYREWFTAAEIADLRLPGLPGDKSSVNRRARQEGWALQVAVGNSPLARERQGRGGGMEFHFTVLPASAQVDLVRRGIVAKPEKAEETTRRNGWAWYERQSAKSKDEAHRRMKIMEETELLISSGMTVSATVARMSLDHSVSQATLYNWRKLIDGVARDHWLPALAPRREGGGADAEIDERVWKQFLGDYLRPECPSLARCFARTAKFAESEGLTVPSERTMRRRLQRELAANYVLYKRKGEEELRRRIPAQRRTVDHLHALEIVNLDGHKVDIWVRAPGGNGQPVRPMIVAIQDVYSSMILAWCADLSENSIATQIAFGNLFKQYGIPKAVLTDNGRAFASKTITGGQASRFRFKIKEDEPTGVLTAVGVNVKWALPYRGQSKPIERAFRDLCDEIARGPACAGAYAGNRVDNKPYNVGERVLEWDEFLQIFEDGIAEHNTRKGRTGRHYAGRSFADVFAESYASAPISKATPEQLRLALLTAEQKTVNFQTSEIQLYGNRYWHPVLGDHRRAKVMVRFDPENLHSSIFVYDMAGHFIAEAPLIEDTGFDTQAGAVSTGKRLKKIKEAMREADKAMGLFTAEQVARNVPKPVMPPMPDAGVVQIVRTRQVAGGAAAARKVVLDELPATEIAEHENRAFAALKLVRRDD